MRLILCGGGDGKQVKERLETMKNVEVRRKYINDLIRNIIVLWAFCNIFINSLQVL